MKKSVIIRLTVEGIHQWKDCNLTDVMYLNCPHRHIFYIECVKEVSGDDREIEIITFKHQVLSYLEKKYGDSNRVMSFQGMSCEMIATELFEAFNLSRCKVMEDNENGAEVTL